MGLHGPITIRRARFECMKTGRMVYPADEALDLPDGQVTASLARRAMGLATHMGFAEVQEELLEQHGVRITDSTLDDVMRRVGSVAERDRQRELEALARLPRGRNREEMVAARGEGPARLYVSCDGITYRTRYREDDPEHPGEKRVIYQEMKVGAVFWQNGRGRWHKRVVTGRDDPERFGLSLWKVAVECGMLSCPEVIFVSDGGGWCNTVAELYFRDAVRILDWYHLSEHIWSAGRMLYGDKEKAARRWAGECLRYLHDGGGGGLMAHLERCRAARGGGGAEALEGLMNYVRERVGITDYPRYRLHGYVIGSGMIESTCKQVVGQRLKGPGMKWSEAGALAMAALMTEKINGRWDEFWSGRPLQRAA